MGEGHMTDPRKAPQMRVGEGSGCGQGLARGAEEGDQGIAEYPGGWVVGFAGETAGDHVVVGAGEEGHRLAAGPAELVGIVAGPVLLHERSEPEVLDAGAAAPQGASD